MLFAAGLLLATSVHAQVAPKRTGALPVLDKDGKVQAVLLLEPVSSKAWQFGTTRLDAAFGVGTGSQLGLVCDRAASLKSAIGNLAGNCLVADLGSARDGRSAAAGAGLSRPGGRFGLSLGSSRDTLPAWLNPAGRGTSARISETALTLKGEKNIGREATVSIGGTVARARLVSPDAVPAMADQWDIRTLTVGANVGRFGASIIGRVVDSPANAAEWQGLDLGLTWRTPWRGQLSVGAENVVTRGRNPFAPTSGNDDGTVPYVRYQQDL